MSGNGNRIQAEDELQQSRSKKVMLFFQNIGYVQEVKLKKRVMSAFGGSGSF